VIPARADLITIALSGTDSIVFTLAKQGLNLISRYVPWCMLTQAIRELVRMKDINDLIQKRKSVIDRVKNDLIQRLSLPYTPDDLHEDVSLIGSGLGLDSLDALEVILGIEQEFDVKVEEGNIAVLRSINTMVDYILANQPANSVA